MPDENFYYTIQQPATAEHKERGSRFLAFIFPIQNAGEAKEKLQQVKKEHPKASHYCFAYRIGLDGNNFRTSDDGEPSGTAGKPVLGQLDSRRVTDAILIVVRYFGGTLLGVPGLINAYRTAASLVLQLTPIVQKAVLVSYQLAFTYTQMNEVMMVVKQQNCIVEKEEQSMFCTMQIGIPKTHLEAVLRSLHEIRNLEIKELKNG